MKPSSAEQTHDWRLPATDNPRALAAAGLLQVMHGHSLNQVLPLLDRAVRAEDRGFLRDLLLGSCRYFQRLNAIAKMLLSKPFADSAEVLHALLIVGLYQLDGQNRAEHAAVHATVSACDDLRQGQARAVINACLRRFLRERDSLVESLADNPVTATSHPKWLVKLLGKAWGEQANTILAANNERAPLCLRVNQRRYSREQYLQLLTQAGIEARAGEFTRHSIYLEQGCDVTSLPGFADGAVSVQDEAAQLAAELLAPEAGERILDACAAPGGKSCHLLESADIDLTAVELEESRVPRIHENLARLGLSATVVCDDAAEPSRWWNGEAFDAILLDAPCSATGVIRRHPDIKMLRRREDIDQLQAIQAHILDSNWSLLKPGGRLLYATCSVLPQENSEQIGAFLNRHNDATLISLDKPWGWSCNAGRQLFPTLAGPDGFFYALLVKSAADNVVPGEQPV